MGRLGQNVLLQPAKAWSVFTNLDTNWIGNLIRLRLCAVGVPQPGEVVRRHHLTLSDSSFLELTALGQNFLHACRGPAKKLPNLPIQPKTVSPKTACPKIPSYSVNLDGWGLNS